MTLSLLRVNIILLRTVARSINFLTVQIHHNIVWLKYMVISPHSVLLFSYVFITPQHHKLELGLTHKAESRIVRVRKTKFLSTV
jgi:hypothetical protein